MAEFFANHVALRARVEEDRRAGLRLAMTNGAFDLLHVGHLRSLVDARSRADRLLVALNSDRSVQMNKGPKRPVMPERERAELVGALACVDYVTLFDEPIVAKLIELLRPEVYCKGTDYGPASIPETATVLSYGGEIAIVGDPKDHSSSGLIARILDVYGGA